MLAKTLQIDQKLTFNICHTLNQSISPKLKNIFDGTDPLPKNWWFGGRGSRTSNDKNLEYVSGRIRWTFQRCSKYLECPPDIADVRWFENHMHFIYCLQNIAKILGGRWKHPSRQLNYEKHRLLSRRVAKKKQEKDIFILTPKKMLLCNFMHFFTSRSNFFFVCFNSSSLALSFLRNSLFKLSLSSFSFSTIFSY